MPVQSKNVKKKKKLAGQKDIIDVGDNRARFKRQDPPTRKGFFSEPGQSKAKLRTNRETQSPARASEPRSTVAAGSLESAAQRFGTDKENVIPVPSPLVRIGGGQVGGNLDTLRAFRQQEIDTGRVAVPQEVPLGQPGKDLPGERGVEGGQEGEEVLPETEGATPIETEGRTEEEIQAEQQQLIQRGLAERSLATVNENEAAPLGGERGILGFKVNESTKGKGVFGGDIATGRNLAVAAGYGLAIGLAAVAALQVAGGSLFASLGGSARTVATAASGSARITQAAQASARALGQTGFRAGLRGAMNTVKANKITGSIFRATLNKKYQKAVGGWIGLTVLNGFLDEESDQTMSFAIDKATELGELDLAREFLDARNEMLDESLWNKYRWLIPNTGVFRYLEAARARTRVQELEFLRGAQGFPALPEETAKNERFDQRLAEQRANR